ncbi:hypothetical protein D6833_02200 [Candidatus Parcubacteria bacterium]|nr:MAG: hypothetical protein D6833_02200 [Candidatus Parcubacteria bacterium]
MTIVIPQFRSSNFDDFQQWRTHTRWGAVTTASSNFDLTADDNVVEQRTFAYHLGMSDTDGAYYVIGPTWRKVTSTVQAWSSEQEWDYYTSGSFAELLQTERHLGQNGEAPLE